MYTSDKMLARRVAKRYLAAQAREAGKKPSKIGWSAYRHRKYLKNVLKVLEARNPGDIHYLAPKDEGYDWVKQKWGRRTRPVSERGVNGGVAMSGGANIFIGTVSGLGPVIISHNRFKV